MIGLVLGHQLRVLITPVVIVAATTRDRPPAVSLALGRLPGLDPARQRPAEMEKAEATRALVVAEATPETAA